MARCRNGYLMTCWKAANGAGTRWRTVRQWWMAHHRNGYLMAHWTGEGGKGGALRNSDGWRTEEQLRGATQTHLLKLIEFTLTVHIDCVHFITCSVK